MTILKRIFCIVIALMLIIPVIPNRADAAEVFDADKIYEKDIHFESTNNQSNLQGFWENNNVRFAISILKAKNILSAKYTDASSGESKTVNGSAIEHYDVTSIEVKDKEGQTTEFKVEKPQNQKFAVINFGSILIGLDFDLDIEIDNGDGHEFGGPIRLVETEGNEDEDEEELDEEEQEEQGEQKEQEEQKEEEQKEQKEQEEQKEEQKEQEQEEQKEQEEQNEEQDDDDKVDQINLETGDAGNKEDGTSSNHDEDLGSDDGNTGKKDTKKESGRTSGNSSGGTIIANLEVPFAELEKSDHFAYIIGYPEGTVKSLEKITRQEAAMIFYRLLTDESRTGLLSDTNSFSDMDSQSWSNKAISTLFNGNIIKGYTDGTFRPEAPITRAEFATMAAKFDNLQSGNKSKFTDIFGHWAEEYITSSEIKGWVKGYPDLTFKPDEDITRAEAISLINNVLGRGVPAANIHPEATLWTDLEETQWYYTIIMEATNSHDYITEENGDELWTGLKANKVWP